MPRKVEEIISAYFSKAPCCFWCDSADQTSFVFYLNGIRKPKFREMRSLESCRAETIQFDHVVTSLTFVAPLPCECEMDSRSPCTIVYSSKLLLCFFLISVHSVWDTVLYNFLIRQRHEVPLLWRSRLSRLVPNPNGHTLSSGEAVILFSTCIF